MKPETSKLSVLSVWQYSSEILSQTLALVLNPIHAPAEDNAFQAFLLRQTLYSTSAEKSLGVKLDKRQTAYWAWKSSLCNGWGQRPDEGDETSSKERKICLHVLRTRCCQKIKYLQSRISLGIFPSGISAQLARYFFSSFVLLLTRIQNMELYQTQRAGIKICGKRKYRLTSQKGRFPWKVSKSTLLRTWVKFVKLILCNETPFQDLFINSILQLAHCARVSTIFHPASVVVL